MMFIDVLAVASIVFACIEGYKSWGVGAVIGFAIGFGLLTLLVPYGGIPSLIACMILFVKARSSRMAKIADESIELES